jgi:chromosomal replication initiation ATPase DnaA
VKHEERGGPSHFINLLLSNSIVSREDLERAMKQQWEEGGTLEEHLVRLGFIGEEEIVKLIEKETPYKFLDIKSIEPDPEAVIHIPKRIAKSYKLIAVRKSQNSLAVAMANPLDEEALLALRNVTDLNILPFVGKLSDIKEAIEKYYPETEKDVSLEPPPPTKSKGFIQDMTFSSFIVSPSNENAYSMALSIAQETYEGLSPVVIYGGPGTGKTHLLHSIGNFLSTKAPFKKVLYLSSAQLILEIRNARASERLESYLKDIRDSEFLLIDDVDRIKDPNIERELSLLVGEMTPYGKRVVFTSRTPPKEAKIEESLKEILENSLKIPIESPPKDLKKKILEKKCEKYNIPDEILSYLADNTGPDIREAFGYIETLFARHKHLGHTITLEEAQKLLRKKEK